MPVIIKATKGTKSIRIVGCGAAGEAAVRALGVGEADVVPQDAAGLRGAIRGASLVLVIGYDGTGASSVVARLAHGTGAATVGVIAAIGTAHAIEVDADAVAAVDTLLTVTTQAEVRGLLSVVLGGGPGEEVLVGTDLSDVALILRGGGRGVVATGSASGDDRATRAAALTTAGVAATQPASVILHVAGSRDLRMREIEQVARRAAAVAADDAIICFSASLHAEFEDVVSVTALATDLRSPSRVPGPPGGAGACASG